MGFPDDRDRRIIRLAEETENLATDMANWVNEFNQRRIQQELLAVSPSDEFELTRLRRLAANLYSSAKVPVAAAVYGPSQVGKSLFVGRMLQASSDDYSPLGRDEQHGPPAYFQYLSFDTDLNPQSGSNEATALVTRFTTKDRIAANMSPEYPVMVRALTRAQWLRVLARGFQVECVTPDKNWTQEQLEDMFDEVATRYSSTEVDRRWRLDLIDAYAYMRIVDRRGFQSKESVLNGLLNRYPLTEDGYIAVAANMFWNNWPSLTSLFMRINNFLTSISSEEHDPAILTHWAGVRFLLDSQRAKQHERRNSRCFKFVKWSDIRLARTQRLARAGVRRGPGRRQRTAGDDPGVDARNGDARPAAPPERKLAEGDRVDRHPGHSRHAGRPPGGGAGQAANGRHDRRADGDRQTRQGGLSVRAVHGRNADPDAAAAGPRRQPGSDVADEVPHRQVGPGAVRRRGLAQEGPRQAAGPVPGHHGDRRRVPQSRRVRQPDAVQHASEPVGGRVGRGHVGLRRREPALHECLSDPLSGHLGCQPESAGGGGDREVE